MDLGKEQNREIENLQGKKGTMSAVKQTIQPISTIIDLKDIIIIIIVPTIIWKKI